MTTALDRALPITGNRDAFTEIAVRARRYPGALTLAIAAFVVVGVSGLVAPLALGRMVDLVTAGTLTRGAVLTAAAAVVVAGLFGAIATWVAWRSLAVVTEGVVADLREGAVDRGLALDAAVIEEAGTGDLVSRVAEDSRQVAEASAQILPWLVSSAVAVLVTGVGMLALDWRLGVVGLVALPMYAASLRWYLPRSGPIYAAERAAFAVRAGRLLGGITGARTLRAYGAEAGELTRIDSSSAHARDLSISVFRLLTAFFSRNNRAEAVTMSAILVAGYVFVTQDWVTAGAVSAAALLFHRLFNPLGILVTLFDEVQSAFASLTRIVGVLRAPTQPRSGALPTAPPARLRAAQITHAYTPGRPVLHDVDLEVAAGEVVALVGSTGAGKTTLASAMAGTLQPIGGAALLDDVDVRTVPETDLRRVIALVSQEVHTFSGTLREDLVLARPETSDDSVWEALATVHAAGWVGALPDGLDTRVGEGGHRLTVVQAQQLALARVVIADPAFVVLDEATAEAGSAGSRELEAAALAAIRGRGALVVAHRLSQARLADRIVVLEQGRIIESGPHDELAAAGGRYAELWAAWSLGR